MIVSVAEVRRALGKVSKKYSDSEVEEVIRVATVLSDLFIDCFIEREKQRKEVAKHGANENYSERLLSGDGEKNNESKD